MKLGHFWWILLFSAMAAPSAYGDEIANDIRTIAEVGPQAAGATNARAAHDRLARRGVEVLPRLLVAMDTTNIVAANWYRSVFERIVAQATALADADLPLKAMKNYLHEPTRQGRVRRLALNLVDQELPGYRESVLPTLLDDPEFRSEAVELSLKQGDQALADGNRELAQRQFQAAFKHARASQQVTAAAERLKNLDVDVNVIDHLGLLTRWYVVGPFDAPGMSGFDKSFPPEKELELNAEYVGQEDTTIRWRLMETDDMLGLVNLVQALAPAKEAVGYAYTEIHSPGLQEAYLKCGADDNLTVWLNDEKIFSRKQWLNGTRLDRFTAPARLLEGANRVLVKVCQGPQHINPAVPNNWSLQLRFCDETGANVGVTCTLPRPKQE